jgi:hypothetical protein
MQQMAFILHVQETGDTQSSLSNGSGTPPTTTADGSNARPENGLHAGMTENPAVPMTKEEEINQALAQLTPETKEEIVSYRSHMSKSTELDNEASAMVKKVIYHEAVPERDEKMKKSNDLYHQSIIEWQAAQQDNGRCQKNSFHWSREKLSAVGVCI